MFFPDTWDFLVVFPLAFLLACATGYAAFLLKRARSLRINHSRKFFHFVMFTTAFFVGVFFDIHRVAAFGAGAGLFMLLIVLMPDWKLFGAAYSAIARDQDEPHRSYFLVVPYIATALGGIITGFAVYGYYQVGYLMAGWGDAAGEPVGVRWGKHRYRVPTLSKTVCTRSLEGSAAVFVVSYAAAAGALYIMGHGPVSLLYALGAAGLTALVEAVSPHGWDNLTTQLAGVGGILLVAAVV